MGKAIEGVVLKIRDVQMQFSSQININKISSFIKVIFLKQVLHRNPVCEYEPDIKYCSPVVKFICQDNKTEVSVSLFEELRRNA